MLFFTVTKQLTLLYTGGGAIMAPPINFEASQLKQEGLFWFNLHTNLVTWVPTMAKTQKNSKCQQCLSYASCDEMIKNSPCKVGLKSQAKTHSKRPSKTVYSFMLNN